MIKIKTLMVLIVFCVALCFGGFVCLAYSEGPYTYQVKNNEATITRFDEYECTDAEIIIPSKMGGYPVVLIEAGVFNYNHNVVSLVIPEGVTKLGGPNAPVFGSCSKLRKVAIPSSLQSAWSAFGGCDIEEIYISDVNSWISIDWWNDWPTSSDIAKKIYCNNQLIEKLIIKEGATSIARGAFNYCTYIDTVTLPKSVTTIGYSAFNGCTGIKDVWYTGTEEDKEQITISSENAALLNATWHYNSCPVGAPHEYSNDCDAECNGCGLTRDVPEHKYDNACDTNCNVCKATRQTQHTYDNSCDSECNVCKSIRSITHSYGQWNTVKKADCTTSGTQKRECSVCHNIDTKNIEPLNHEYETKWTVDKEETCTEAGSKSHHCIRCDTTRDITTIKPSGHAWGKWVTVKEATTAVQGKAERKCSSCNLTEIQTLAKLAADGHAHKFGEWEISKAATCAEKGRAEHKCLICKESESKDILATGHQVGEWEEFAPTCTEDGRRARKCLVCGKTEEIVLKTLGHEFDGKNMCVRCGEIKKPQESIEKVECEESNNPVPKEEKQTYWIIGLSLFVVAVVCGGIAFFIIKRKKK